MHLDQLLIHMPRVCSNRPGAVTIEYARLVSQSIFLEAIALLHNSVPLEWFEATKAATNDVAD